MNSSNLLIFCLASSRKENRLQVSEVRRAWSGAPTSSSATTRPTRWAWRTTGAANPLQSKSPKRNEKTFRPKRRRSACGCWRTGRRAGRRSRSSTASSGTSARPTRESGRSPAASAERTTAAGITSSGIIKWFGRIRIFVKQMLKLIYFSNSRSDLWICFEIDLFTQPNKQLVYEFKRM